MPHFAWCDGRVSIIVLSPERPWVDHSDGPQRSAEAGKLRPADRAVQDRLSAGSDGRCRRIRANGFELHVGQAGRNGQAIWALRNRRYHGAFLAHPPRQHFLLHRQQSGTSSASRRCRCECRAINPALLDGIEAMLFADATLFFAVEASAHSINK